MTDTFADYDPATLPVPVVAYLDAHDRSAEGEPWRGRS